MLPLKEARRIERLRAIGILDKNLLVISSPSTRFYAGVRLTDGIGALCVIGRKSRRATETEILKLTKLAQYVDIQMMAHGALFNLK